MRIAVLGGGVAGVVLARELSRTTPFNIDLYEYGSALGGLQRSVAIDGLHYDIGSFLFAREHALLRTFPVLYDHFLSVDHRSIVITQHHSLDIYPMSMRGYIKDHNPISLAADVASLLVSKISDRRRDSLRAYVHYYLGKRVYQQSGLKAYIERFYAVPDSEVDLEFAMQRLDELPVSTGLRHNIGRIVREAFDPTIAQKMWRCFVRPREGFPYTYSLIETELRQSDVRLRLNARIERIERIGTEFRLHLHDLPNQTYDLVISTIPVGAVMRMIGCPMPRQPETMRLISLCYRFNGDLGFKHAQLLYNFTYDGNWKRLNLFSQLYGTENGDEYFAAECTVRQNDPRTAEDLRRSFEHHVATLPILKGSLSYRETLITDNAYPFFHRDDLAHIEAARQTLSDYGIVLTGRQGQFKYMNANATALAARELARQLQAERTDAIA